MSVIELPLVNMRRAFGGRRLDEGNVKQLMQSIQETGRILHPLFVRETKLNRGRDLIDGYEVIAGGHRFEAAWKLNMETAPCIIATEDALLTELIQIDENLVRLNLTSGETAVATDRRKDIYEIMHPEASKGKLPGIKGGRGGKEGISPNLGLIPSFINATAAATGKSRTAISRDAQRGKVLKHELPDIIGTVLDIGDELDALMKKKPEERKAIIAQVKAGKDVSARKQESSVKNILRAYKAFLKVYAAAEHKHRKEFSMQTGFRMPEKAVA
jgi:ParB/RepB/Spo0J family partition protein